MNNDKKESTIRKMDPNGRMVIPKGLRLCCDMLGACDCVLSLKGDGILIQKFQPTTISDRMDIFETDLLQNYNGDPAKIELIKGCLSTLRLLMNE